MNILKSASELKLFLDHTINDSGFLLQETIFSAQDEWLYKDGALSHQSQGFFHLIGLKDLQSKEYLLLYQPQSALTGLAICIKDASVYVLLQARIEPGNSGIGQYGPTIQSTPANFLSLHGGKPSPYLDLFYGYSPEALPLATNMQVDIGSRYFLKSKWHNYVLLSDFCETLKYTVWVPLSIIEGLLDQDNFFNADLRSLLAVFHWDKLNNKKQESPFFQNKSILNDLRKLRSGHRNEGRICPVGQLLGWEVCDEGIRAKNTKDISALYFKVSCTTREVSSWVQPLVFSQHRGLVVLLLREYEGIYQCLLSLVNEIGIDGGYIITASVVKSPGQEYDQSLLLIGKSVGQFVQSDEGGRFYKHESIYRIALVDSNYQADEMQYWVSLSDLRSLFSFSNITSFQLRCIASLLQKNGSLTAPVS